MTRHKPTVVGCIVGLLMLLGPRIALAHVVVLPVTVPTATSQVFTVRVPTEKEVPTISVRIEFPAPLVVARFEPMPGWTRVVDRNGAGRIVAATWSGGSIAADEYQDFVFLGRTPREPGMLVFPSYQTYEGGEVVAWTEAQDQNHPAPTVEVIAAVVPVAGTETHMESTTTSADANGAGDGASPDATAASAAAAETVAATPTAIVAMQTMAPFVSTEVPNPQFVAGAAAADGGGSDLPLFVSLGALVTALVAVALAAVALARHRASS